MQLFDKVQESVSFIKQTVKSQPQVGIILGSGLGGLCDIIENAVELEYSAIPHFPVSTVQGHGGKLIAGKIGECDVMMMSGRFHYYEGYSMEEVTFPVRVMKAMGIDTLILSNAAGGMNKAFKIGDLMLITDHINLFPEHPLRGPNDERFGPRFPDMSKTYDETLLAYARDIAKQQQLEVKSGTYIGLQGPTFETPAEYKWLHVIGGDAVGMSTVPEVIVARHSNMRVFGLSVITDIGISDVPVAITHEEVLKAANAAAPKMAGLVAELVKKIKSNN